MNWLLSVQPWLVGTFDGVFHNAREGKYDEFEMPIGILHAHCVLRIRGPAISQEPELYWALLGFFPSLVCSCRLDAISRSLLASLCGQGMIPSRPGMSRAGFLEYI